MTRRAITLGSLLVAAATVLVSLLGVAPAEAVVVDPTAPQVSSASVPTTFPGDFLTVTASDVNHDLCGTLADGDSFVLALVFKNPDGLVVGASSAPFTYASIADPTYQYSWSSTVPWMTLGIYGLGATQNWHLTYKGVCYVNGVDVSGPPLSAVGEVDYAPVAASAATATSGESVTFSLHDATPEGHWCNDSPNLLVIVADSLYDGGASALIHLTGPDGVETIVPANWTSGSPGVGLYDESTRIIDARFDVPRGLTPGDYSVGLECVNFQNHTAGYWALSTLTITEPSLPDTGLDLRGMWPWSAGLVGALVVGVALVFARRRRRV